MFTAERLDRIFTKTAGRCHLCGEAIRRRNYAKAGGSGGWEVDHSRPRARGGTDHLNNLFPACISCNRSKQHSTSRAARARLGRTRAPLSQAQQEGKRHDNALGFWIGGTLVGLAIGGPAVALLLGLGGVAVGASQDPEA